MFPRALIFASGLLLVGDLSASATSYGSATGTVNVSYRVAFVDVNGVGSELNAEASFTPDNLTAASGTVSVRAASLRTGNGLQENHLRGALGAEAFPNIVYALSGVNTSTMLSEGQTLVTTATGKLSLKGVTKPLSVPLKLTLTGGRVNVSTQFKFNPHDYGVDSFAGADSISINVGFVLTPR